MPKEKIEKNEEEEIKSVPFLVYFKGFLLVGAILFGMFFLSKAAEHQDFSSTKNKSATLSSISKLQDSFSKEEIQKQIDHEIRTNQAYKDTVNVIENKRDEVLGEATKAAEQVSEQAKQTIFDYVYQHTVGVILEHLIKQMPSDQKEKLIENVSDK